MRKGSVYFNTSILIRAVNPRESGHRKAIRFIDELFRRGFPLVVSTVHSLEVFKPDTLTSLSSLFMRYRFRVCWVDVEDVRREARLRVKKLGVSDSRLVDVMHLIAARRCGCKYIAAVDRFIRSHAPEFGLKYINYYTGIP